jgi:hypothetical protein
MHKQFSVGDRVTWRSQAAGIWKVKTGTIVEVIRPHTIPRERGFGTSRKHESYIVEVKPEPVLHGKHQIQRKNAKPETYWPRVSNLKLVRRGSGPAAKPASTEPTPRDPVMEYAEAEEKQATAGLEKFCDTDALGGEDLDNAAALAGIERAKDNDLSGRYNAESGVN